MIPQLVGNSGFSGAAVAEAPLVESYSHWDAQGQGPNWLDLDFGTPTSISAFRLKNHLADVTHEGVFLFWHFLLFLFFPPLS